MQACSMAWIRKPRFRCSGSENGGPMTKNVLHHGQSQSTASFQPCWKFHPWTSWFESPCAHPQVKNIQSIASILLQSILLCYFERALAFEASHFCRRHSDNIIILERTGYFKFIFWRSARHWLCNAESSLCLIDSLHKFPLHFADSKSRLTGLE